MRHQRRHRAIPGILVAFGAAAAPDATPADAALSPDARAASVERLMTDEERFNLLHGLLAVPFPGLGAVPPGLPVTAGYVRGVPRLHIPDLRETDASLGVVNPLQLRSGDYSTALPSGLALAATFDTDLALRSGTVIGNEARNKGFNVLLAGGVNLARDPRNGRNFEYLGEDPLLAGSMAGASVRGIQREHVVSTVKHFALNDQETLRNSLDVHLAEGAARESDLLAFQIAIEQGQPGSVMCAYNKVAGAYSCGSDFLLNQVVKGDWQFPGWVMSDWGAVHGPQDFAAGLDQESGEQLDAQVWFDQPLKSALAAGRISRERLTGAVRRILRSIYAVGADEVTSSPQPVDFAAHAQTSLEVATAGIVLLKNQDRLLPISGSTKTIAVIGGHADQGVLSGGGSSQVTSRGPPAVVPVGGDGPMASMLNRMIFMPPAPLSTLRAELPVAKIVFDNGYVPESAAAVARNAQIAIVFATQWQTEAADGSLRLPQGQDQLIEAVAAANPHTIVVLETGNPVKMPWLARVGAVVEAWYPGDQGAKAITQVLTGSVNPSGRLPVSFPADESQLPRPTIPGLGLPEGTEISIDYPEGSDVGYRWFAAKHLKPLFPFGYGLTYSTFEHSHFRITGDSDPVIDLTLRNVGLKPGIDVAQVYLTRLAGVPTRRLVAFSRVALGPGESQTIHLRFDQRLLARWTPHGWEIPAGNFELAVGQSSLDLEASVTIELQRAQLGRR